MKKTLLKSVSLVSSMTFISRILGFIRDLVAARLFGVNASVDAFYIAFKIPNFMRSLFAEGAFSQAFIPILSEYQQTVSKEKVQYFIANISAALGGILLFITCLGVLFANQVIHIFAPFLDETRFILATQMLRITFPYLFLISMTAFSGAILNSYGRFGIPSFTPALLNLTLITTALGFSSYLAIPVTSQAYGILIAGFLQLCLQIMALHHIGFSIKPIFNSDHEGLKRVFKLLLPSLFGASMGQLSILLNTVLGSFLITGSISWLYYSERLAYFPLGVFGVALATVILPHLSREHAKASQVEFSKALDWGVRWNLMIGCPAMLTMLVLSGPLIVSLFQYGKFTMYDVIMTQKSVITYAIGLPAFMLNKLLSSAFYAKQDIRTPVKLTMAALFANLVLSLLLFRPLAHAGLALASSLSAWFNVILLTTELFRRDIYTLQAGWRCFLGRLALTNIILSLFLSYFSRNLEAWLDWHWSMRLLHLFLIGTSALIIYASLMWFPKKKQLKI